MVAQPRRGAVHDRVHRVGVVGDRDQAAGRDRRRRPGARVDLGLGDTGVAVAHLPIDVRAAGAIGAEAVHAFVEDDVHRQWGQRRTVLDLLAGPQNPNDEGPVIESSSPQVLTAGQRDEDWRVVRRSIAASCRGRAAEAAISTPAQARLTA